MGLQIFLNILDVWIEPSLSSGFELDLCCMEVLVGGTTDCSLASF